MKSTLSIRLLLFSFVVSLCPVISAQNYYEIRGKIVKTQTRSENRAKVLLLDSQTMEVVADTYSNSNGDFIIENIQSGEYLLMAKKPGNDLIETKHISITDKVNIVQGSNVPIASKEVKLVATNLNELKNF